MCPAALSSASRLVIRTRPSTISIIPFDTIVAMVRETVSRVEPTICAMT